MQCADLEQRVIYSYLFIYSKELYEIVLGGTAKWEEFPDWDVVSWLTTAAVRNNQSIKVQNGKRIIA